MITGRQIESVFLCPYSAFLKMTAPIFSQVSNATA